MRILLIEDESSLRAAILSRLRGLGHAVDVGGSCADLDRLLVPDVYSAVILDRLLPDGDSLNALAQLRREGASTPVLLLSALNTVGERVEGLRVGGDDYLTKPFSMDELVARVEVLGRRRTAPEPAIHRVGELEIHRGRREVRRHDVVLPLRPKEYELLSLLMGTPLRVITKAEIHEACWDAGADRFSNVEEVLVANLRRKLGAPNAVKTVRGAGYMLDEEACCERKS